MYTVTIPVMMRDGFDIESSLEEIKRAGAERVLLSTYRQFCVKQEGVRIDTSKFAELFRECIRCYEAAGLEVGIWLGETMGHGYGEADDYAYQRFTNINGVEGNSGFCCADELFRYDICKWASNAAEYGAKLIILDDDWRMSAHGTDLYAGCMCENHIKRFCDIVGEKLTREEIREKVFSGEGSRYRDAWQDLMGEDMLRLAHEIRAAVDKVNPQCRIGLCTAPTVVDLDGADFMQISSALAGKTRPVLRLIGAPYWAQNGADLASVVTTERMEAKFAEKWMNDTNAEVLFEGDVYPRPRFNTPAAYLEASDMICRADGHFTGAFKYMLDYTSSPRYEHGYIDKAEKNCTLARSVEEMFAGKRGTGFRLYEYQKLFHGLNLPDDACRGNLEAYEYFRGLAVRYMAAASVPISFDDGVAVIFGENAKYVPESVIEKGAVLDIAAAIILTERGFDVGLANAKPAKKHPGCEVFKRYNEKVPFLSGDIYDVDPCEDAEVLTEFDGGRCGAYIYENGQKSRYLVYPLKAKPVDNTTYFRSYTRQRELYEIAEWISGERCAAEITGSPDVYIMTSKNEQQVAVGIWNLFPDTVDNATVKLPRVPDDIRFVGCIGKVSENEVMLGDIIPFGFAGFVYR